MTPSPEESSEASETSEWERERKKTIVVAESANIPAETVGDATESPQEAREERLQQRQRGGREALHDGKETVAGARSLERAAKEVLETVVECDEEGARTAEEVERGEEGGRLEEDGGEECGGGMTQVVVDGGGEAEEGGETDAEGDTLEAEREDGVGLEREEEVDGSHAAVGDVIACGGLGVGGGGQREAGRRGRMSEERGEGDGGLRGAEEGQQVAVGEAEEEVGHLHVAEEKCAADEGGEGSYFVRRTSFTRSITRLTRNGSSASLVS